MNSKEKKRRKKKTFQLFSYNAITSHSLPCNIILNFAYNMNNPMIPRTYNMINTVHANLHRRHALKIDLESFDRNHHIFQRFFHILFQEFLRKNQ